MFRIPGDAPVSEAVTNVIVARSQEPDGLSAMVVWSITAHAALVALALLWPVGAVEPPPTIMTVSLTGAPGPKTEGLNQIGGEQPIQEKTPEPVKEPVKEVEAPPAPKAPAMTLPDPKARTRAQTKAKEAPSDAIAPKPSIGERPHEGTARVRGQGFGTGLSSSGGSGGGVQLDGVTDFCCPEYIDQMRVFIQRNWEQGQGVAGSTGVKFTITRNGMIQTPQVERPSGFDVLDLAAMRALQRTTLPPLPNEFPNPTLTVHMRFDYSR